MAWGIRVPVKFTLDPAPREREDRRQRENLTEEMRRFKEVADKDRERREAAERRKAQDLISQGNFFQRARDIVQRQEEERTPFNLQPPTQPLRELAAGFAPPTQFGMGPPDIRAGGQAAQQFFQEAEDLDPERLRRLESLRSGEVPSQEEMTRILESDLPFEEKQAFWQKFRQAAIARQERAPVLGALELPFAAAGLGAEKTAAALGAPGGVQTGVNIAAQVGLGVAGARIVPSAITSRLPAGARTALDVAAVGATAEPRRVPRVQDLGRTLAINDENARLANKFIVERVDPAFRARFGDAPAMSVSRRFPSGGEPIIEIHTAGWRERANELGLEFVGDKGFATQWRLPPGAPQLVSPPVGPGAAGRAPVAEAARFDVPTEQITPETVLPPGVSRTSSLQGQQVVELPAGQLELPFPRTRNAQEIAGLAAERRTNAAAVREGALRGRNTADDVLAAEADLSSARQADITARQADLEDLTKRSFDDLIAGARRACRG